MGFTGTDEYVASKQLEMADDIPENILKNPDTRNVIPSLYGALLENEQDVHLLEKLAFEHRAKR